MKQGTWGGIENTEAPIAKRLNLEFVWFIPLVVLLVLLLLLPGAW